MTDSRAASSITTRLTASMVSTVLLAVVLVGLVGVGMIRQAADRIAIGELHRQASAIARETSFLRRDPIQAIRFLRNALDLSGAALYEVLDDGSLLILGGAPNVPLTRADVAILAQGRGIEGVRGSKGDRFVFVAQPISGNRTLALVLGRTAGLTSRELPLARRLLAAAVFAMSVAALVASFVARRITSPLRDLAVAAADIATGDFTARVEVSSDDEVGVVASSFNKMAAELGDADRLQREFFLSISHELRTPLTAIQGYAEAIEDGTVTGQRGREAAGVIIGESKRLNRLVSDVLDLARLDAKRFTVNLEDLEVSRVLKRLQQSFAQKASESGVALEIESTDMTVKADGDRLIQVLSNLVENGMRYTPTDGRIRVSAAPEGSRCRFDVVDGGPGLDPSDFRRAFDRQYLWGKYRGVRDVGTGLGLAITKELVEAMGGEVSSTNDAQGGARFSVLLPMA